MSSHYQCGLKKLRQKLKLDGTTRWLAEINSDLWKNPTSFSPIAILRYILISEMLKYGKLLIEYFIESEIYWKYILSYA